MKHEPHFYFNSDDGSSMCIIETKNKTFVGTAYCAEADRDMMSEKVGCEIAYHRAIIKCLNSHRDELKIKIAALQEYYYTMNKSKYFDKKSYPIRRLDRQIELLTDELETTKELVKKEQDFLKHYMEDKAEFYTKIRKNRKANLDK